MTIVFLIYLITNDIITVAIGIALYSYRGTVLTDPMGTVSSLLEECKSFNISCNRVFDII